MSGGRGYEGGRTRMVSEFISGVIILDQIIVIYSHLEDSTTFGIFL